MTLLLRSLGLVLLLAGLALAGLGLAPSSPGTAQSATPPVRKGSATFAPLPAVDAKAGPSILEHSPFATDRSAFNRDTAATPPPPPVEVKLTGIYKVGKQLRANLLIGGQPVIVKKGDEIAAGKITKIEASAVEIEGASRQRLEMFKR